MRKYVYKAIILSITFHMEVKNPSRHPREYTIRKIKRVQYRGHMKNIEINSFFSD